MPRGHLMSAVLAIVIAVSCLTLGFVGGVVLAMTAVAETRDR